MAAYKSKNLKETLNENLRILLLHFKELKNSKFKIFLLNLFKFLGLKVTVDCKNMRDLINDPRTRLNYLSYKRSILETVLIYFKESGSFIRNLDH